MRVRALALAGLSTVLLTACSTTVEGSASPAGEAPGGIEATARTGPEIADAAAAALQRAGSVRMEGTMPMDGEEYAVQLRVAGDDLSGSFRLDDMAMQIVVSGGEFFMRAPAGMWEAQGVPAGIASGLGQSWVRAPAGTAGDLEDATLAGLVAEIREPSGSTIEDRVTTGELDGRPVWLVHSSDGSVLYVAAEGTPYPVQMTTPGEGSARLTDFGRVDPIVPPADYMDLGG